MKRVRHLLLALTVVAGFGAVGTIAFAYFSASGSGSANASVSTLDAPTDVAASAAGATVNVTWTGVLDPDGGSTVGYWVQRYSGSMPTDACGSSLAAPIAVGMGAQSCDDTSVASGTYTYTVTSVFRSWTAASAASDPVTVSTATLDHFTVTAPGSATAGTAFSVTVAAKDESNNTLTGYTGTVHFSTSDLTALALPSDYTFVGGDNGTHTFSSAVILRTAGAQTVSVNDTVETSKTGTSSSITVAGATLDHFVVTAPSSASVATAFTTATTSARDIYDNPAGGWTSAPKCVVFSGPGSAPIGTAPSYPAQGGCGAGESSLTFDASGQASGFSITLYRAETTSLTATASGKTGTSGTITVSPGTAVGFLVTAPSSATAGTPFSVTSLTARDAYLNVATGYSGSHTIAWSGPGNAPSGTAPTFPATSVSFTSGISTTTLNATLVKAESTTLTASETSGPLGSAPITVAAGTAANFLVSAPASATAGTQFSVTSLTARDVYNNIATGYVGTKAIAWSGPSNAPNGTAPTFPATSVSFTAGVSTTTLNATLVKAESATLTASASSPTVVGSASITVSAAGPASLSLGAATITPTAGVANNLTITASTLDAFGNTAASYSGDKNLTFGGASASPNATVPTVSDKTGAAIPFGSSTTITFTSGVATVSGANNGVMKLYKAGAASITVTDGTISNGTGLSVTVSPAAAAGLKYVTDGTGLVASCPSGTVAVSNGGSLTTFVALVDQFGNPAVNGASAATVSITKVSGGGGNAPSPASLTIIANANPAVTSGSSLFKLPNGSPADTTYTATLGSFTTSCIVKKN